MCNRGVYTLKAVLEKTLESGQKLTTENLRAAILKIDIPGD
jgi:hypothetical protein